MMNQIRTVLLLAAFGCGSATGGDDPHTNGGDGGSDNVGVAGADAGRAGAGAGGEAGSSNQGGAGGSSAGSAGSAGQGGAAGAPQGGAAGEAGSNQGGSSGAAGEAGSAGQGGSAGEAGSAGQGGSDQGGSGGSEAGAGGSAGEAGSSGNPDPAPPACTFEVENGGPGTRCTGLLFETCTLVEGVAVYESTQCGVSPEVGMMCDGEAGCAGECANGATRCSGDAVETCGDQISGEWSATESCAYQCVNGACAGACEPEEAVCDGASVVTCGQDFRYGDAVACEGAPNANPTCSGAGECGTACVPGFDDCSAAPGCETDLSSPDSCGACGNVCPGAPNATRTCNGGVCGLQPNACAEGTGNCTGDFVCETNTDSDENNCGGCGVKCYGTCSEGQCSVEVVGSTDVLDYSVVDLFVGTTHVYWWTGSAESSIIWRAPKDGSEPAQPLTTFANPTALPRDNALLVNGGYLYWGTVSGVFRMPEAGGTVTTISTSGTSGLVIADGKLYWNNVNVNAPIGTCLDKHSVNIDAFLACNNANVVTFYTYDVGTQGLTTWTTNQFEYGHVLAVGGGELFVARFQATPNQDGGVNHYNMGIVALNATTGAFSRGIVSNARDSSNNAVSLGDLFNQAVFTDSSVVFATNLGLFQTSITNPGEASIIKGSFSSNSRAEFIAVDASAVYYPTGSNIDKISRSTSAVSHVIANTDYNARVALDGDDLYWTMQAEGRQLVLRTAK